MDECIDSLGEANVFTTLDANSGYWQDALWLNECTGYFPPYSGHLALKIQVEDLFSLFGRCDHLFPGCGKPFTACRGDPQSTTERRYHLKFKKCEWFAGTVRYLGQVIKPGQLAIQEAQTAAFREVQPPSTQKQLRSFLGLCNVYRRFVPRYSHIAAPLNAKLSKGQIVQLEQFRQAERVPIGSLNAAEKKYSVSEKECLAVVWALTTLRPYLQGERFTVNTDH
ncbi:unnamed protein product [Agarophyton chilense]